MVFMVSRSALIALTVETGVILFKISGETSVLHKVFREHDSVGAEDLTAEPAFCLHARSWRDVGF